MTPLSSRIVALYEKEPGIRHYLVFRVTGGWYRVDEQEGLIVCTYPRTSDLAWPRESAEAMEGARTFMEEDWAQLTRATRGGWSAVIGSGEEASCSGDGETPLEAVVALWEDVLGMDEPSIAWQARNPPVEPK